MAETHQVITDVTKLQFPVATNVSGESLNIGIDVIGTPMMLLNPHEFEGMNNQQAQDRIRAIEEGYFPSEIRYDDNTVRQMAQVLISSSGDVDSACAFPFRKGNDQPPIANVVIMSHPETYTPEHNGFLSHIPFHDGNGNFPGRPEDNFLMTMFHEVAHGLGDDELGAEIKAAQAHKDKFNNNAFLKFHSDVRAVSFMLNANNVNIGENGVFDLGKLYPWQIVEGLDQVISQESIATDYDQPKIPHMEDTAKKTERNSKDVAFLLSFQLNDLETSVKATRNMMWERSKHKNPDQHLNEDHIKIAERFILACKRLSIGEAAYTNSNDPNDIAPEVQKEASRIGQEPLHKRLARNVLDLLQ